MEWIKLKDKNPPKDGRYLFYEPDYNWIGIGSSKEGKLHYDYPAATHWMYLPEPPKDSF